MAEGNPQPPDGRPDAGRPGLGHVFFFIYLAIYGGFVLLNAFAPSLMETTPVAGVNLAISYGVGLIVAALVLALLYGWLCATPREGGR
jgi:uncharacterized membrane protein (DUF485 family)